MKHDRSHRRDVRRHADPSVICLPGPRTPYTPPRKEPEAADFPSAAMAIPDDEALDAELLAHGNIFEVQPRMSRQARRKALRAERKAARRAVTERFLAGAPSLGEAAAVQFSVAAMPTALMEVAEPLADADVMLAERPEPIRAEEIEEVEMFVAEAGEEAEPVQALPEPHFAEDADDPLPLGEIAQLISAAGPLIVERIDGEEEPTAESAPLPNIERLAAPDATAADEMESEPPEWLVQKSRVAAAVPIEAMTTPLPRHRALVPAKRSWLLRVMPWLRPRRKAVPSAPALTELQNLRFELVGVLHRLDQIIDRLPETARQ